VDEARKVIRRLERIDALRSEDAPARELLDEVRQLLTEGEAWLAAEGAGGQNGDGDGPRGATEGLAAGAAAALEGCRARLTERREVRAEPADSASI
jgi:hypothetical protein